jgi:hypothetical protein
MTISFRDIHFLFWIPVSRTPVISVVYGDIVVNGEGTLSLLDTYYPAGASLSLSYRTGAPWVCDDIIIV